MTPRDVISEVNRVLSRPLITVGTQCHGTEILYTTKYVLVLKTHFKEDNE